MTFEQIIGTQQADKLDNLAGELYSLEAESYRDEVCFGWQFDQSQLADCNCKHCGQHYQATKFESHSFCSPECDYEYNITPPDYYETIAPSSEFLD